MTNPSDMLTKRIAELDGIRAVAVLMVLMYHLFCWSMEGSTWTGLPLLIMNSTAPGWLGVDLFFVLSGFLITGILLETRDQPSYLRNFYARRAFRILPLYYTILLLVYVFYPHAGRFVSLSMFFLSNITPLFGVPIVYTVLWSLAVEEHFYLIWPWVVKLFPKRVLLPFVLGICCMEPVIRAAGFSNGTDINFPSWYRFDGIAWGAALAIYFHNYAPEKRITLVLSASLFITSVLLLIGGLPHGIMTRRSLIGASLLFTMVQLAFTACIAAAVSLSGTRWVRFLAGSILHRIGELSYCLYLVHIMVIMFWDRFLYPAVLASFLTNAGFLYIVVRCFGVIFLSYIAAELSFRYLETPFQKLKRFFINSERNTVIVVAIPAFDAAMKEPVRQRQNEF